MADQEVCVVSAGMMTSVGLSAPETAASVRAAVMRFAELDWYDRYFDRFMAACVPDDALPDLADDLDAEPLTSRERRLLRLGTMPLLEALQPLSSGAKPVPLALGVPETATTRKVDGPEFMQRFARQTQGAFDPAGSNATFTGRAGGLMAIAFAMRTIRDGLSPMMLAGGVDSYIDLYVLGTLDLEQRIKSDHHLDGFIPAEGGCFLLLASREAAQEARLPILARLSGAATALEPGHLYSDEAYRGDGLAEACAGLFADVALEQQVEEVYSSMNGESHWAKEWGVAFLRNASSFSPQHGLHHPADCIGDTGAAAGPILTGLACLGVSQGYRRSPCFVFSSSDHGDRAALVVTAAAA